MSADLTGTITTIKLELLQLTLLLPVMAADALNCITVYTDL